MELIRRDRLVEQLQATRAYHFTDPNGNKDIALGLTMAIHAILEQPVELEIRDGYTIETVHARKEK